MKINNEINTVSSNFTHGANDMTIDAEGMTHIISILTNLYEDPEKTVIREYYSNALDSHVASGVSEKIEVTAPSLYEPTFVVQDYGVGMSEHDILSIYSSYGKSTKRDSNDQVGAFGLGCKSALSYANQFSVEAVKDGMLTVALIARKDNGGSECTIVAVSDTDKPNGVRVSIPVSDRHSFYDKMSSFFKYADSSNFNLIGYEVEYFKETYREISEGLWAKDHAHYGSASLSVVMGGVQYPVSKSLTSKLFLDSGIDFSYGTDILIELPIGDVDLTPSRESMQETERTVSSVTNHFERFVKDMCEDIQLKADQEPSLVHAKARILQQLLLNGLINRHSIHHAVDVSKFESIFTYDGVGVGPFLLQATETEDAHFDYGDSFIIKSPKGFLYEKLFDTNSKEPWVFSSILKNELLFVDVEVKEETFKRWVDRSASVSAWPNKVYAITPEAVLTEDAESLDYKRISFDDFKKKIKKEEDKLNVKPTKSVPRTAQESSEVLRNTDIIHITKDGATRMNVNDFVAPKKYITLNGVYSKSDFRMSNLHKGISKGSLFAVVPYADIVEAIVNFTDYEVVALPQWFSKEKIPKNLDLSTHSPVRRDLQDLLLKNISSSKKKRDLIKDILDTYRKSVVSTVLSDAFVSAKFVDPEFKKMQRLRKSLTEQELEMITDGTLRSSSSASRDTCFDAFDEYVDDHYSFLRRKLTTSDLIQTKGLAKMFNIMYTENIKEEK